MTSPTTLAKEHPKYRAQVVAGLIDDPEILAQEHQRRAELERPVPSRERRRAWRPVRWVPVGGLRP